MAKVGVSIFHFLRIVDRLRYVRILVVWLALTASPSVTGFAQEPLGPAYCTQFAGRALPRTLQEDPMECGRYGSMLISAGPEDEPLCRSLLTAIGDRNDAPGRFCSVPFPAGDGRFAVPQWESVPVDQREGLILQAFFWQVWSEALVGFGAPIPNLLPGTPRRTVNFLQEMRRTLGLDPSATMPNPPPEFGPAVLEMTWAYFAGPLVGMIDAHRRFPVERTQVDVPGVGKSVTLYRVPLMKIVILEKEGDEVNPHLPSCIVAPGRSEEHIFAVFPDLTGQITTAESHQPSERYRTFLSYMRRAIGTWNDIFFYKGELRMGSTEYSGTLRRGFRVLAPSAFDRRQVGGQAPSSDWFEFGPAQLCLLGFHR